MLGMDLCHAWIWIWTHATLDMDLCHAWIWTHGMLDIDICHAWIWIWTHAMMDMDLSGPMPCLDQVPPDPNLDPNHQ